VPLPQTGLRNDEYIRGRTGLQQQSRSASTDDAVVNDATFTQQGIESVKAVLGDPAVAPLWESPVRSECPEGERGCERWRIGGGEPDTVFLGPTIFAEYGYATFHRVDEGGVHGFQLADGEGAWTATLDAPVRTPPAAGRGLVVAVADHDEGSTVHAFAAVTGRPRWRSELDFRVDGPVEVLEERAGPDVRRRSPVPAPRSIPAGSRPHRRGTSPRRRCTRRTRTV
jgi:outer membrane protein assembly factor BamB